MQVAGKILGFLLYVFIVKFLHTNPTKTKVFSIGIFKASVNGTIKHIFLILCW